MDIYIKIVLILCVIIGISLAIYFLTKKKDKKDDVPKGCNIPTYTQQDFDKIMSSLNNNSSINYGLSPGNGIDVMAGGNPQDMLNPNDKIPYADCNSCLDSAAYDPSDKSLNSDPAYYSPYFIKNSLNGNPCQYSEFLGNYGPPVGTTIAVKGIQNGMLFTCDKPGMVYNSKDPNRPTPYTPPTPNPPTPTPSPYDPPTPTPSPYDPPTPTPSPYNPPTPTPSPYNPPTPTPGPVDPITLSNLAPVLLNKLNNNQYVDPNHVNLILNALNTTQNTQNDCNSYYSDLSAKIKNVISKK